MRVVQMHDQRAQRQLLVTAFGTGAHHAFEAFEQAIEPLRADAVGRVGQTVNALVGRAERAGAVAAKRYGELDAVLVDARDGYIERR